MNLMTILLKANMDRIKLAFCLLLLLFIGGDLKATTWDTIPKGSYIINLGITPQTIENGLKPYGLVHVILEHFNTPIIWAINPNKTKDGIDFSHNGVDYRGSAFIIDGFYRTKEMDSIIGTWKDGTNATLFADTTISDIVVPVEITLKAIPNWVLDQANGSIAEDYMVEAGIPSTYYGFKNPEDLNCCDEIYVMPHADPTWATHSNLHTFLTTCEGSLWGACHAVSVLENVTNGDTSIRMNFLSDTALVHYSSDGHDEGTLPFSYAYHTHPVMQFMDILDDATQNGSEQIYLPNITSQWRPTTMIGVWDSDHDNLPGGTKDLKSNGEAAAIAFGPTYGSDTLGFVMYEGGHNHGGSNPENIAAQRAFLNFAFWATQVRALKTQINITLTPNKIFPGDTIDVSVIINGTKPPYSVQWLNSCNGSFENDTLFVTKFYHDPNSTEPTCNIQVVAGDTCGNITFEDFPLIIYQPPVSDNDSGVTPYFVPVAVDVIANDFDANYDSLTVTIVGSTTTAAGGTIQNNNDGTVLYTPPMFYVGWDSFRYEVCDETPAPGPFCDTNWVYIQVTGTQDSDGDGILDAVDVDDDNDGIPDVNEQSPLAIDPSADADGDFIPNYVDTSYVHPLFGAFLDANGDGVNDHFDWDMDGLADHIDLDGDNDGIPDALEGNQGVAPANYDATTGTITGSVGLNGMPDAVETASESGVTTLSLPNTDGDLVVDWHDGDSDNDGIPDVIEAGGTDADGDGYIDGFIDSDGDGLSDGVESSQGGTALPIPDSDSDTNLDYLDIDSDNDGITDNIESQPTATYQIPSGLDADYDGIDDAYDPDYSGIPVSLEDTDGDGTYDFLDLDSDNDSIPDLIEGNDFNQDGIIDNPFTGTDSDNDGLDDAFDINAGWGSGNETGSNSPIQNTDGIDEKDWRDTDDDNDGILTSLEDFNGDDDFSNDFTQGGSPTPDYLYSSCVICFKSMLISGYADTATGPADNPLNVVGPPDGVYAGVKDNKEIYIDLGDTIPPGILFTIRISGGGIGDSGTVTTSLTSGGPYINPLGYMSTVKTPTFENFNYVVSGATHPNGIRYIRIVRFSGEIRPDAVSYSFSSACTYPGNSKPTAVNDAVTTPNSTAVDVYPMQNDIDPDEYYGTISIIGTGIGPDGTFSKPNDTTIRFTPNGAFAGNDTVSYEFCDSCSPSLCDTALIIVTVLQGNGWPLPLAITDFLVYIEETSAIIYWELSMETDIDYFEIQKSGDGENFQTIQNVPSKGSFYQNSIYTEMDKSPFFGDNYYRLKQVDFDGEIFVTEIRSVHYKHPTKNEILIYPNPFADVMNLRFSKNPEEEFAVIVSDMHGQRLKELYIEPEDQSSEYSIEMKEIPEGIFILKVVDQENHYIEKIMRSKPGFGN